MKLTRWQKAQLRWAKDGRERGGFWMTLLLYAVLFVASELLRPKPELENAKPAGLGDFSFPTATEGRSVPIFWGTVRIDGPNVVWYGDLRQEAITEKVKTGLFSSETIIRGFKYRVGMQFALARGPIDSLLGVWVGDGQVYTGTVTDNTTFTIDDDDLFGGDDLGNGGFTGTFRLHAGTATQTTDSYLAGFQVFSGDTPAYRGTAYLCPDSAPFYVGNSTSIKPYKFEIRRIPNGLSLTGNKHIVSSSDANPANVIYEILTNTDWGLGYDTAEIDTTNFTTVGETLYDEGNGFSMIIDSPTEASEVIRLLEEQIDGVLFFNQAEGKWQINLVRADYTVSALDPIDETNSKLVDYSRGSWENTTNQVRVQFRDRTDEYKQTFAIAQDSANVRIQNNVNITSQRNYPGVMNRTLANSLAWRDLRTLSYPLAKAKVVVDRSFWDAQPAGVYRYSNDFLGISDLAMRVQRIDFGELENNRITLDLVQDVFYTASPSFGDPTTSGWTDPFGAVTAFASDEQLAFEAPRALVRRDPTNGALANKIYAAARQSGLAGLFEIRQRNAAGVTSGSYTSNGVVYQFMRVGTLTSALTSKSAYPLTTLNITDAPDSETDLLAAIATSGSLGELGINFTNLILVDNEFMLVEYAQGGTGTTVDMKNVYRGALDSVQASHSIGADVYIISAGGGISTTDIDETNNVDVKLIPKNQGGELIEASATTISFQMDKRIRRPYPPSELDLNGTTWDTSAVSLEANGSGAEDYHIDVDFLRRDYRVADSPLDISELDQLGTDANTLYSDFPTANSTDHLITVYHDPTGSNDVVYTSEVASGTNFSLQRIDVLYALAGVVPTGDLRVEIQARHTDGGETLTSRQSLSHDFEVTTTLTGQFEFGLLDALDVSALYTATTNGTYSFTLSSAFSGSDVQYRLNGGSWTNLITAGLTSGSIVGVVATDTIELRWTAVDTGVRKQLDMNAPGAGQDAFAILGD